MAAGMRGGGCSGHVGGNRADITLGRWFRTIKSSEMVDNFGSFDCVYYCFGGDPVARVA